MEGKKVTRKSFNAEYEETEYLGQGAFGEVYAVVRLKDQQEFAAKIMAETKEHIEECNIMLRMEDLHTLSCHEFFVNTDKKLKPVLVIIMDKAESNLDTYLSNLPRPIPQKQVINMLCQIGLGIEHLHLELEITHRDLKPKNILVMKDNILKIADFGIAKEIMDSSITMSSKGDRVYAAPEVF